MRKLRDEPLDFRLHANVQSYGDGGRTNLRRNRLRAIAVEIRDNDLTRTFRGESSAERRADATGASRDDGNFSGEFHDYLPVNAGARFSRKCATPSLKSSDLNEEIISLKLSSMAAPRPQNCAS